MHRYPITIKLLSETIFGSGEAKNGVVNTDILLDEKGLPYYLGKTFKGNVRDCIENILYSYYSKQPNYKSNIQDMFGVKDKEEGSIRFSNFYLSKNLRELFKDEKINPTAILTDVRYAVKLNDGVAEDKSLRTDRVLRKGLVFCGYLESDNELKGEKLELLQNAMKALKNLGAHKSRGKGLVKITMLPGEAVTHKVDTKGHIGDFEYILYELNLEQPMKIGASESSYDYSESKSYITGAAVRGAVIKSFNETIVNEIVRKVNFYDAYPMYGKAYSFPTPGIFRISKEDEKKAQEKICKKDFSIVFDKEANDNMRVKKLRRGEFSFFENNTLKQFNIKKELKFHHARSIEKENIFRYEAICKNQKFYGIIDIKEASLDMKKAIFNKLKEDSVLYIGGSRNTGYGKTIVEKIEGIKDFEALKSKLGYFNTSKPSEEVNIYFLSNTILRDESLQITQEFNKEYLEKELGAKVENVKSDVTPVILTGFNSYWNSKLPEVYGIESGSVINIKFNEKVKEANINNFIKKQSGDRKQEGMGRLIINPSFLKADTVSFLDYDSSKEESKEVKIDFKEETSEMVKLIKRDIEAEKVKRKIKEYIVKRINGKNAPVDSTNSQFNKFIRELDLMLVNKESCFKEMTDRIKELGGISQNEDRNKRNSNLLKFEISNNAKLGEISEDKIDEILKEAKIESCNINKESIVVELIRELLYYSLKAKGVKA